MRWLTGGLENSQAQWKVVDNPVMIAPVRFPSTLPIQQREALDELVSSPEITGVPCDVDQWDGCATDRRELLDLLRQREITDTAFLAVEIHSAWRRSFPPRR